MLHSNGIPIINSINNFEQLIIFFGLPILFLLLIMKCAFLITINFHKNTINNGRLINKTKTIILQFLLWFLAQFFLFLLPIQEIVINVTLFDLNALPLLTIISLLHLGICFSFLSNKNNKTIKIMRFTTFVVIIAAIILQFNFTMIKISLPSINNLFSFITIVFFYYWLIFFSWKMFSDNLLTTFILIKKTWAMLIAKTLLPNIITEQQPIKTYSKVKQILLTWQFEQQPFNVINNKINDSDYNNKKLLITIYKKNLTYFLNSQIVLICTKTIQDLKTLINGWKIREIK